MKKKKTPTQKWLELKVLASISKDQTKTRIFGTSSRIELKFILLKNWILVPFLCGTGIGWELEPELGPSVERTPLCSLGAKKNLSGQ
jgi:hypothetical protein